jgi:hypothetical protein
VANVESAYDHSIVIITEGTGDEYRIPKSEMGEFDGTEAFLKPTFAELRKRYRMGRHIGQKN